MTDANLEGKNEWDAVAGEEGGWEWGQRLLTLRGIGRIWHTLLLPFCVVLLLGARPFVIFLCRYKIRSRRSLSLHDESFAGADGIWLLKFRLESTVYLYSVRVVVLVAYGILFPEMAFRGLRSSFRARG